jgi:hypothetical protein
VLALELPSTPDPKAAPAAFWRFKALALCNASSVLLLGDLPSTPHLNPAALSDASRVYF